MTYDEKVKANGVKIDWLKRCVDENSEVKDRIQKIVNFKRTDKFMYDLDYKSKRLLNRQLDIMLKYSEVLSERIIHGIDMAQSELNSIRKELEEKGDDNNA